MVIKNNALMENKRYYLCGLFFLWLWSALCQQQPNKPDNENLALNPAVRYGKLENGFTYYLQKNDSPSNSIELRMVVKAGIYHEDQDQFEYAHLLEHMGFKGTKHFPDLTSYFHTAGRYAHAGTRNYHTYYYARIPSGDKTVLNSGMQVVRDWAQDIRFEDESIKVEREAVLAEMRANDSYKEWLSIVIKKEILKNTGVAIRSQKTSIKNIKDFDENAFLKFYKDWYRPDLEAAIIVGNINVDSVEMEIKRLFSDLKTPKKPKNAKEQLKKWKIELNGENQYENILDTVSSNFRIYVIGKFLDRKNYTKNSADYKAMLLQELYELMITPKVKQLEQQFDPPFTQFFMNYGPTKIEGQLNYDQMRVDFENDEPKQIKEQFFKALVARKQIHMGFTNSELAKAKIEILKNYSKIKNSNSSLVTKYVDHFVRGAAAPDPQKELKLISRILDDIDLKEIQAFIKDKGDLKKNMNFLFFKGKEDTIPNHNIFKQWVNEVDEMKVELLPPIAPPLGSLEKEVQIPVGEYSHIEEESENILGVSKIVLKNGIKLLLKPTKPKSDRYSNLITINAYRPNMVPFENREEYLSAKVVPEVLTFTGTGSLTKFELEDFKQNKDLRLNLELSRNYQKIYARSKEAHLDELLNLLYLYLEEPRIEKEGFTAWKINQEEILIKDGLGIGNSNFYMDKIRALWYPEVPNLKIRDLKDLTTKNVSKAHDKWFSDLSDYTFIITGDFDKNELAEPLVQKLAGFPIDRKKVSKERSNIKFPLKKMDETIRLNNINQAYVRIFFPVKASRDIKTQIELELLSQALNERIFDRLREGCYFPGAGGEWMDMRKEIYSYNIRFDSELGNEDKLIQMALEEFRKLRKDGVDKEWLEKTIRDEKATYGTALEYFSLFPFWPDYLQRKIGNGEDVEEDVLQYKTVLEHFISLEDVNVAARKYFNEENLQKFLVLPRGYKEIK